MSVAFVVLRVGRTIVELPFAGLLVILAAAALVGSRGGGSR